MKKRLLLLGGVAILAVAALTGLMPAMGADHADAPLSKANHQEDLADVYAFNDAGTQGNVVFAMTVNPLSMPGDAPAFDQAGLYQFKIDNNADAVADVSYNATFGAPGADGSQTVTLRKQTGAGADDFAGGGTQVLTGSTTAGYASPNVITQGSTRLFAGLRDDPFFFDLDAFKNNLMFRNPGVNFFAGLNVSAIVLSIPSSDFAGSGTTAGVWAVTSKSGTVIDRMGRPAINTVFIPADQKDNFNATKPSSDVSAWKPTVVAKLEALGRTPADADTLANALLPDILTFDTGQAFAFLNGRALANDVIDAELQLITGNNAATDNVANDSTFLTALPFLGAPNQAPAATPTTAAPAAATPTRPSGVVAPNTGTGDTGGGGHTALWLLLGVAGAAGLALGGGAVMARRVGR